VCVRWGRGGGGCVVVLGPAPVWVGGGRRRLPPLQLLLLRHRRGRRRFHNQSPPLPGEASDRKGVPSEPPIALRAQHTTEMCLQIVDIARLWRYNDGDKKSRWATNGMPRMLDAAILGLRLSFTSVDSDQLIT